MIIKNLISVALIFSLIVISQNVFADNTDDVTFSLTAWNDSLETVLYDIEQETGFTITIDNGFDKNISGMYNNITIYDFFSIVLNEGDYSISKNNEEKSFHISKSRGGAIKENVDKSPTDTFIESEADYINEAKNTYIEVSDSDKASLQTDKLTGKTWTDVEKTLKPSDQKQLKQLSQTEFLEAESEYTNKAKMAVANKAESNFDKIDIDPISGKPWTEIEQETLKLQRQD